MFANLHASDRTAAGIGAGPKLPPSAVGRATVAGNKSLNRLHSGMQGIFAWSHVRLPQTAMHVGCQGYPVWFGSKLSDDQCPRVRYSAVSRPTAAINQCQNTIFTLFPSPASIVYRSSLYRLLLSQPQITDFSGLFQVPVPSFDCRNYGAWQSITLKKHNILLVTR